MLSAGSSSDECDEDAGNSKAKNGIGLKKQGRKSRKAIVESWGQYSHKVMDVFETTKFYHMIDQVSVIVYEWLRVY